jgi:hypothetical protein
MPYGSVEFEEYGAFNPFIEWNSGSPLYGKEVYFDSQGNEYQVGFGPIEQFQSQVQQQTGVNLAVEQQVQQQMQLANPSNNTVAAIYTPVSASSASTASSASSSLISGLEYILTSDSIVSGVPNWAILTGVVLGFWFFRK